MSGRKFRILSDSEHEDEGTEVSKSTQRTENTGTSSDGDTAVPKRKRARILSDNTSDDSSDDGRGNRIDDGDTSEERNDESPDQTTLQQGSHGNDENVNRGQDSDDRESVGSGTDVHRRVGGPESDENISDGNQSDANPPGREPSENEDEAEGERPASRNDEAEEAQETSERRIVKKRVVKNPQPKLDAARLIGDRGLGRLRNMHASIRLRGKGYEHEDIKCILHNLQLWGHRLFPKMQSKDIFERCGRLGTKMAVRVHLRRMRTGEIHDFVKPIVDSDDDVARGSEEQEVMDSENHEVSHYEGEEEPPPVQATRDAFQDLLEQTPYQTCPTSMLPLSTSTAQDDLEAKIRAKRMEALRRREELRARREAQQGEEELL